MRCLVRKFVLAGAISSLLSSDPSAAQILPPSKKLERVEIVQGPALELAYDHLAIVRWTTNNPGGSDVHFGVVYYGTNPDDLDRMAKSPIRLNRSHPETIFRVRLTGLSPRTTYYIRVTSLESGGTSDGIMSPVARFTTPRPGERIVAHPHRKGDGTH